VASPREILDDNEYSNYRNIRAISVLFVLLGSVFLMAGIGIAAGKTKGNEDEIPPAVGVVIAVAGAAGIVGGIAALGGSRRWSRLSYVMAVVYLFAFPIGTLLSFIMLKGLSNYLFSKELIARTNRKSDFD
jgi:peptidoglycan/LPS O-acetylase OafA/YrhL